jgi:peptidoglycan/xylan/chitin deacetylase (PgdA/CDA1 family)
MTDGASPGEGSICLTFDFDTMAAWMGSFKAVTPGVLSRGEFGGRVGIYRVLDVLDRYQIPATFFIPGYTADSFPDAVKEIARRGHEIGHHGYLHESPTEYLGDPGGERAMYEKGTEALERVAGVRPAGYRSPGWDLTENSIRLLAELGFRYDSSQYDSPRIPQRIRGVPRTPYRLELGEGREIWEYPVTVWPVRGRSVPMGGGAYWRALPTSVLRRALREVAAENSHPVLYFHPYELDPQPLRATLPESPTPKQRALTAWKSVQRNPGRRLVADRIRAIAREYTLTSYEEAHGEVVERYGARPRSLSRAGVVV